MNDRCKQTDLTGARCVLYEGHFGMYQDLGTGGIQPTSPHEFADAILGDKVVELAAWWRAQAEKEVDQTVAKAVEYSGLLGGLPADLVDLGRQIAFVQRREHDFTDAELAEIGVWSYMQGKMNRWSSALRNGRMVSDDTLTDLAVYTRLCMHIREKGTWP